MVSVIIPVYNAQKFLLESINSILRQTYSDIEVLVCDDKSTDGSLALATHFKDSRLTIVNNATNQGYLRTINRLLKLANGDFIAFHDADDISHSKRMELQVAFLKDNPTISLVGTNFELIDIHGNKLEKNTPMQTDPDFIKENLIKGNLFQKPSVLFRREVYDKIGGFREGFLKLKNISEDYDWLLRASENFQLSNVNGEPPLYRYRSVPSAMSKNYARIEQHIGHKVAQFLAVERQQKGVDSLMTGAFESLFEQIEIFKLPYKQDRSLFYFEKAESFMYNGLFFQSLQMALLGFLMNPWKWRNLKCVLVSLKRWLRI